MTSTFSRRQIATGAVGLGAALAAGDLVAGALTSPASADTATTGSSQLAYAENATGITQASIKHAAGNVDLTNMTITVSPTTRPVYLTASIGVYLTSGKGAPLLKLIETTGKGYTPIESAALPIFAAGLPARIVIPLFKLADNIAAPRTFKLQIFVPKFGSPVATVEHGAAGGRRSTLLALAA